MGKVKKKVKIKIRKKSGRQVPAADLIHCIRFWMERFPGFACSVAGFLFYNVPGTPGKTGQEAQNDAYRSPYSPLTQSINARLVIILGEY